MSISTPTITNNIKIDTNFSTINLNNSNGDYNLIYERNGYGSFYYCTINLDKKETLILFKIDDNVIIEVDLENYTDALNNANLNDNIYPLIYDNDRQLLSINFGQPVSYKSSITICAKSNDNRAKKIDGVIITLSKDDLI